MNVLKKNSALKICATTVVLLIVLIIGIRIAFHSLGYSYAPNMYAADRVAEKLIQENRSAQDCLKIQTFFPSYPPLGMLRTACIHEFARLKKDASTCTLLLPDEFAFDCIGAVWGKQIDESNCHWLGENKVRCFEGPELISKIFTCEKDNEDQPDECQHRIAYAAKDEKLCDSIKNSVLQGVCKTRIEAWQQYPELRATQYLDN